MIAAGVTDLAPVVGTRAACAALAVSRATHYRRTRGRRLGPPAPRPRPVRALTEIERAAVLETLHAERFVDASPAATYATLLDEGTYLASDRTMYRLLAGADEVRERRDQRRHPAYAKPELLATGPNELWSWDIERHEALTNRAVMKGHRRQPVAAGWRSWGQPDPRDVGEGGKQPRQRRNGSALSDGPGPASKTGRCT